MPDGLEDVTPANNDRNIPLAAAVARGCHWNDLFLSGKYGTIEELANKVGVDKSFVTIMMGLALLAPDIIDAIMDGVSEIVVSISIEFCPVISVEY